MSYNNQVSISAGTAFKAGFFGFFGAMFASFIVSIIVGVILFVIAALGYNAIAHMS